MHRRRFLHTTGLGLAALSPLSRAAFDCYVERPPGVQLFTLRDALSANPGTALRDLAAAGIREVELYGLTGAPEIFGMSVQAFRRLLDRYELAMTCSHVDPDQLDIPALAANADILGINTIILNTAPGFMQTGPDGPRLQGPQSRQEMDDLVALLDRLGRMFRREGLLFGYHNHHVEFFEVDGEIPFNYLMWNTDPQLVRCELDLGWIALAGVSYLDMLDLFGNRTIACHLKDFNGRQPVDMGDFRTAASHLVAPGRGSIDFAAVLERMDYFGIRHGFVEVDYPGDDPFYEIAGAREYLQSLRGC